MKNVARAILLIMILCLCYGCVASPGGETPTPPATENPPASQQPDLPVTTAENVLLDKQAKANEELLPRGVDKNHEWVKTAAGNTITVYYPSMDDSFTYDAGKNAMGESAWLSALKNEYDITIHAVRKSPSAALSAQRLALLSGLSLDLLAFTPSQLPYAVNMTADATDLLKKQDSLDFLNPTLLTYGNSGSRFFTPAGVARNLWYLSDNTKPNSPLALSESNLWDLSAFTNFVASATKTVDGNVTVYGIEAQDYTDFLYGLDTPLIGFDTAFTDGTADALPQLKQLQTIHAVEGRYYNGKSTDKNAPAMAKSTLAMRYGRTPFVGNHDKYPSFSWAPLPTKDRNVSRGTLSACAPVLALPAGGSKNQIALAVALLWSARSADANHDLLRFTYGMSYELWEKYYDATRQLIRVVPAGTQEDCDALLALITAKQWEDEKYAELCAGVAATVAANNERLPK